LRYLNLLTLHIKKNNFLVLNSIKIVIIFFAFLYTGSILSAKLCKDKLASWDITANQSVKICNNNFYYLPTGNSNHYIVENFILNSNLGNIDTGGLSEEERIVFSKYANSIYNNKYYINNIEITHPLHPGTPFIKLPLQSIEIFESSNIGQSNFIKYHLYKNNKNKIFSNFKKTIGGATLIPDNLFDRHPAQSWGSPSARRKFNPSGEFSVSGSSNINSKAYYFAGNTYSNRKFVNSQKDISITSTGYINFTDLQLFNLSDISLFIQNKNNSKKNIYFNPKNSLQGNATSSLLINKLNLADKLSLYTSIAANSEKYLANYNLRVSSLEEKILYPYFESPYKASTYFSDNLLEYKTKKFQINNKFRYEYIKLSNLEPNDLILETYKEQGLYIYELNNSNLYSENIIKHQADLNLDFKLGKFQIKNKSGIVNELITINSVNLLRLDPLFKLDVSKNLTKKTIFMSGISHLPISFNSNLSGFLNPSNSYKKYSWQDNNNLILEENEKGIYLSRGGGKYHSASKSLEHPVAETFYSALKYRFNNFIYSLLNIYGILYRNLYTVEYLKNNFNKVDRNDAYSGYLYNRKINSFGKENYIIKNNSTNSYILGTEWQIIKLSNKDSWYFNLSGTAVIAIGNVTPGNGPFLNDIGAINEESASPNAKINAKGRLDYDRAYIFQFIFGKKFLSNYNFSGLFKYKDGNPLGEYIIAEGLTQGPTPVMNSARGGIFKGKPRYTFIITMDTKLTYETFIQDSKLLISVTVFNILDIRSETSEYPISDSQFRRPLETIPARIMYLSLNYLF